MTWKERAMATRVRGVFPLHRYSEEGLSWLYATRQGQPIKDPLFRENID
jgi:hypothetical protein